MKRPEPDDITDVVPKSETPGAGALREMDADLRKAYADCALVVTPHPMTLAGQQFYSTRQAALVPGETLAQLLARHGVLPDEQWVVALGGIDVPQAQWTRMRPKAGHLIEARRVPQDQDTLRMAGFIALMYFTMGAGGIGGGSFLGLTGGAGYAAAGAAFIGGSLLINKVLPPKAPGFADRGGLANETSYSLSGGRNRMRPFEPMSLVLGQPYCVPDLAAQPYTYFANGEQYLWQLFHAGINCASVDTLRIGQTPIANYQNVNLSYEGFASGNTGLPLLSNVDVVAGALLDAPASPGAWVTRTSSVNTIELAVDLEGSVFSVNTSSGAYESLTCVVEIEYRLVGDPSWTPLYVTPPTTTVVEGHFEYPPFSSPEDPTKIWVDGYTTTYTPTGLEITNASTKPVRLTYRLQVAAGQYEVRARKVTANTASTSQQNTVSWTTLKSYQLDAGNYKGQARLGIQIQASGQLNGSLDEVNWIATANPMPYWDGAAWVTATSRANGLSNPGAQLLLLARGIYDVDGRLLAGHGFADAQIDIEGLKGFMVWCAAKGFFFDYHLQQVMSIGDLQEAIAGAGMGAISWHTGKFGVIWFADDQPVESVMNMGTMKVKSFSVDYDVQATADELEVQYFDRARGYAWKSLRVLVPGVATPVNTARQPLMGVTDEAHAAILARFYMAQNIYQRKTVTSGTDLEHLTFRRGTVIALSHDLTQWGYGGRVQAAVNVAGTVTLMLDDVVPAVSPTGATTRYMGLRIPGESQYRIFPVVNFTVNGHSGTAQAGAAKSLTLAATASEVADIYKDMRVHILSGTGAGQERNVVASRRNHFKHSETFSSPDWQLSGAPTITPGQTDMVGGTSASLFAMTAASNALLLQSGPVTPPPGAIHQLAIDLKSPSGNQYFVLQLKDANGVTVLAFAPVLVTPAWQRFSVIGSASVSAGFFFLLRPSNGVTVVVEQRSLYVGRPMFEDISANPTQSPSEYVRTEAAAAFGITVDTPWTTQPDATSVYEIYSTSRTLTLASAWPGGVAVPGDSADNPAHDTIWIYDFKATPGQKLRVASIEPQGNMGGARVALVPESAEFWTYVWTGAYTPPPNTSLLQGAPVVTAVTVTEQLERQGGTYYTELTASISVTGSFDSAELWGAIGTGPKRLLDSTRDTRLNWRGGIDDVWLLEVRPFSTIQPGTPYTLEYSVKGLRLPPAAVGAVTVTPVDGQLEADWPDNADIDLGGYEVRAADADWGTQAYLYRGRASECTLTPPAAGTTGLAYIKAWDTSKNYSVNATLITFTAANVPNPADITHSFGSSATIATITIDWADAAPQLGLRGYEVSYDAVTKKVDASTITLPADWVGNRDFTVKTVDLRGNKSAGVVYQVTKLAPNSPINFAGYAIDNNAVFSWTPPAKTTLPISHYLLKRDGVAVGRTDKAFDNYTESESGTHTYELLAVDTDSRESAPAATMLTVFQPPDYILAKDWVSDYSGTKSNAIVEAGALVLPVNTTQTFADHFTANGWTTPQQQVDAGFSLFIQPGATTGYYEEIFDYGALLASMSVSVLYSLETLAGVLSSEATITVAQDAGFTTGVQTYYGNRAQASNFRYVKVRVTVTATDNQGVGRIAAGGLTTTLDAKLRTEQGVASMTLGGAHAQRNIAQDYKTLWVPGMAMPPAGFTLNGTTNENKIVSAAGPSGISEPVWACVDYDVASDGDGGWNAAAVAADCSKGHLFAVCMRTSTNNGDSYFGTDQDSTILDLSGAVNANPYFLNGGDLPALNTWHLVVGYLHEIGYGTTDTNIAGVYNLAGTRLVAGTEFKAASGKTSISHRAYHNYNPTGSLAEVQWMARPVVIPCTVAEAPNIITYLLKCAKEYGARVPLPADIVDVASINLTAYGDTPTSAKADFYDIPNPKSFNIFNWNGASLVAGDVAYIVRRY